MPWQRHASGETVKRAVIPLTRLGHDTQRLRSKSWDEFSGDCPIAFGTIVTLCNSVAGEVCPVVSGEAAKLHWDIPDPSSVSGDRAEIEQAFEDVHALLSDRIRAFIRQ